MVVVGVILVVRVHVAVVEVRVVRHSRDNNEPSKQPSPLLILPLFKAGNHFHIYYERMSEIAVTVHDVMPLSVFAIHFLY